MHSKTKQDEEGKKKRIIHRDKRHRKNNLHSIERNLKVMFTTSIFAGNKLFASIF
jgi:hypothetical protein